MGERGILKFEDHQAEYRQKSSSEIADDLREASRAKTGFAGMWDSEQSTMLEEAARRLDSWRDCPRDTDGDGDCGSRNCTQLGVCLGEVDRAREVMVQWDEIRMRGVAAVALPANVPTDHVRLTLLEDIDGAPFGEEVQHAFRLRMADVLSEMLTEIDLYERTERVLISTRGDVEKLAAAYLDRPWTPPWITVDGQGFRVKMSCPGCGNLMGDVETDEIEAAMEGGPALVESQAKAGVCLRCQLRLLKDHIGDEHRGDDGER